MKKVILGLALAMSMVLAGGDIAPIEEVEVVQVQDKDFYVGVSTTIGDSIVTKEFETFSSTGYGIQAGYTFYRDGDFDTSVEARYMAVVTGSIDNFEDFETYGAFIKPRYNFEDMSVYGLIGYTAIDKYAFQSDGFAYGLGASVELDGYEIFVDYVINDDDEFNGLIDGDINNELIVIGLNYRF
ncbi:MAG: outer membrane beta-barrel protein [Clostridiales bacterium]|nr:outer membrane beta-barrel protein [Clostridiales bacterium]